MPTLFFIEEKMIPYFILEQYKQRKFSGKITAGTMFVDISGFTFMTQKLMEKGKEGVEILTDAMNFIFAPAIRTIMSYDGFISTFAGDAFTAIFPMDKSNLLKFLSCALQIKEQFEKNKDFSTKFGKFSIKVKIGMSYGDINWKIIGSKKFHTYLFEGKSITMSAIAEQLSNANNIMITNKIHKLASEYVIDEPFNDFFFELKGLYFSVKPKNFLKTDEKYKIEDFIPNEILNFNESGEFRKVISCFISVDKNEHFYENISKIMDLAHFYKGYFNKIDFGDKGYVILVIFGAPIIPDNLFFRAAEFALRVKQIKNLTKRIGMSFGVTFSGFIGSDLRNEYTSIGMTVNRAARLMMAAKQNDIFIDENLKQNLPDIFETEFENFLILKGFTHEIATYKLIKKQKKSLAAKKIFDFINRENELKTLKTILNRIERKNKSEIVYLSGQKGVGKTALLHKFKEKNRNANFNFLSCDPIIQKSFYPFKYHLKELFSQSDDLDKSQNLIEFNIKYDEIIAHIKNKDYKEELENRKKYIQYFLDLGSIEFFKDLSAEIIYKNILFSLTALYQAITMENNTVFVMDEADYLDEDSINLYQYLLNATENQKILFIFIYRENKITFNYYNKTTEMVLQPFTKSQVLTLSISILKKIFPNINYLPKKTLNFIYEKTEGIPLFVEQTLQYMISNKLIDEHGKITTEQFEIPSDISLLIISKIDKFDPAFKKITKVASVMGKKFTNKLLGHVVKEKNVDKFIKNGEKENIWLSLSKLDHIFKSTLIRDSVYELILKKELYKLHKSVADSILKLYNEKLEFYYPDIAYNYEKAEMKREAIKYLDKAVEYSLKMFELSDAIKYLKKLLELDTKNALKHRFKLIELLIEKGKAQEAKEELDKVSKEKLDNSAKNKIHLLYSKYFVLIQDYGSLQDYLSNHLSQIDDDEIKHSVNIYLLDSYRALHQDEKFTELADKLLKTIPKDSLLYAKLTNNIGIFHLEKSDYNKAKNYFKTYYDISEKHGDKLSVMKALHNLGITESRLGNREAARKLYNESLDISIKIGDDSTTVKLLSDIASIYSITGKVEKALKLYQKAIKINKTIGNKMQQGILYYNIAEGYFRLNDFDNAIKYLNQSIEICKQINDLTGIGFAYDLLGDILFSQNKFDQAKKVYKKNLKLQKQIKDTEGIAHTYGNLGNLCKMARDYKCAENYYKKQINILKKVGDIEGEGKAWFNWAMVETEKEEYDSAKEKLKKAIKLFEQCSFKYGYELAKKEMEKLNEK